MPDLIDAYQQFFQILPEDLFIEFGLENIISIDKTLVANEWKDLCRRIHEKKPDLYVRDSGRNGNGNEYLSQLYSDVFGLSINYDQTNNNQPTKLIQKLTGHRKNKTIFNYQVSHVFGRTKNVFCFTAPWNIVFIPKIVDPLTGHEAKGDFVGKFSKKFQQKIFKQFLEEIEMFNEEMREYRSKVQEWIDMTVPEKDRNKYLKEFEEIRI